MSSENNTTLLTCHPTTRSHLHRFTKLKSRSRGGVEDTRLEAKAKDTKKFLGQGQGQPYRRQILSRPWTRMLEAKAKDQRWNWSGFSRTDPTGKFQNHRRSTGFWPARSTGFFTESFCSLFNASNKKFSKGEGHRWGVKICDFGRGSQKKNAKNFCVFCKNDSISRPF